MRFREPYGAHATFAHVLVELKMVTWVLQLIEQGLDVNAVGGRFHTLLQTASAAGSTKLVDELLERGTNLHARGGRYETALIAAAHHGCFEIVEKLLSRGADANIEG